MKQKLFTLLAAVMIAASAMADTMQYVDLGLTSGTLWATCNVGATNPQDYGKYFAWGETTTKSKYYDNQGDYKWGTYDSSDANYGMTKYNTTDGKTVLEAADDAATANWGGKWRMPTTEEQQELRNECKWEWTTLNGVNGYRVTSKKDTNKSIFLPAAGYYDGVIRFNDGSAGDYWSSSVVKNVVGYASYLYFTSSGHSLFNYYRYKGQSVRPVQTADKYTLTVTASTGGTVTGGGTYFAGRTATLTATANAHYQFVRWSDGNTSTTRTITVNANATYTAEFTPIMFTITTTANNAAYGTVTGAGTYQEGTELTLTATPNEGYAFTGWSDGNTDNPRTITVTKDATYTANFSITQHTLTLSAANGSISGAESGKKYDYGTTLTLTAVPNTGYAFTQWSDGNTDNPRTITIKQAVTYTANFALTQHTITLSATNGSISGAESGKKYDYGTIRTLTATPDEHYVFTGWSDGNQDNPRSVTVTEDATFTAEFAAIMFTITTAVNDASGGTVTEGGEYQEGTELTLTATANEGYAFTGWSDGNQDNPRTITVTENATFTAEFTTVHTITLVAENGTISGAVSGTQYVYGTELTLTATPDQGYAFVQWSDGNQDNPRTITVTEDMTYTAEFALTQHTITLSAENGTISGAESGTQYLYGTELTLMATANEGCIFTQWSDGNQENPRTITVTQDSTFTAEFTTVHTITLVAENGTISGAESGTQYAYGTELTLTATPNDGYVFTQWSDGNTTNPRTITVTQDSTLSAVFKKGHMTDNLVTNGDVSDGATGWTISGDVSSADGVFMTSYDTGTITQEIDLIGKGVTQEMLALNPPLHVGGDIMMPTYTNKFNGIVKMIVRCLDADKNTLHTITVIDDSKVRTGWDWTTFEAQATLPTGTRYLSFELAGKDMLNWAGHYGPQFDNMFARLMIPAFTITATANDATYGTVTGGGEYASGSTAVLTATANEHYVFTGWSDGNTDNPRTITVTEDATYTATFVEKSKYTITLLAENGTITGAESDTQYYEGTELTLTATPNIGYAFVQWSDGNQDNPRTITVTQDSTFTVEFTTGGYTITLIAENGTISGALSGMVYVYGTELTLTATADKGYAFTQWSDGNQDNPRTVTVTQDMTYTAKFAAKYVDLGLPSGTLWATCNVGASAPEQYGDYFAWGETQPKSKYSWSTYAHGTSSSDLKKYNATDGLTVLDPEDDAATANWGGDWRMPTYAEQNELRTECTWSWTADYNSTGKAGYIVTSKKDTSKSIFLPAAGYRQSDWLDDGGSKGYYLSSSLYLSSQDKAYSRYFYSTSIGTVISFRYSGLSVRPVQTADKYTLTVTASTGGTVTGGGDYFASRTATLTATPDEGYAFVQWSDGNQDNPRTITVTEDATYTATFVEKSKYTITLLAENGTITGAESDTQYY